MSLQVFASWVVCDNGMADPLFVGPNKAEFFCKNNSLNPLRFSLARNIDTITGWAILAKIHILNDKTYLWKKATWHLAIWKNWCFGQFYHSRIQVLQIAQLMALVIFVLVSLMWAVRKSERIERKFKKRNPIPSLLNLQSIEKLNFGQAFTTNKKMPCSKNLTRLMKMLPR